MDFITTWIESAKPIGKTYEVGDDGNLKRVGGGHPVHGTVTRERMTLDELVDRVRANDRDVCAFTGTILADEARFVPQQQRTDGAVSRGNVGDFLFRQECGVMWFDLDAKHLREFQTPEDALDALFSYRNSLVDWRKLKLVVASSSSAFVYGPDGEQLRGATGWRIGVVVADCSDIPRAMRALEAHHWLSGAARGANGDPVLDMTRAGHMIADDGKRLEKTVADWALHQPDLPVYVGGCSLPDGYEQKRVVWSHDGGEVLDTRLIADVTANLDLQAIKRAKEVSKAERKADGEAQREAYVVRKMKEEGLPRSVIESRTRGVLKASDKLKLDDGRTVSVRDVLTGKVPEGTTLASPCGYDDDRPNVAIVIDRHHIFSFSHGGIVYTLEHDADSFSEWMLWAAHLPESDPEHIHQTWTREQLRLAKEVSGIELVRIERQLVDVLDIKPAEINAARKHDGVRRAEQRAAKLARDWAYVASVGKSGAFVRLGGTVEVALAPAQLDMRFNHVALGMSKLWTEKALVSKHNRRDFLPGRESDEDVLNHWTPSKREPREGDAGPWLDHVLKFCDYDRAAWREIVCQAAWRVRYPGEPCSRHLILVSPQGAGKWALLYPISEALGGQNTHMINGGVLVQDFNGYLWRTGLLVVDETELDGKGAAYQKIKNWTGGTTPISIRGIYAESTMRDPAGLWVVVLSNRADCLNLDSDDRRFFVVQSNAPAMSDEARKLWAWYETGGHEIVLDYLMNDRDVTAWLSEWEALGAPAETEAKKDMSEAALTDYMRAIREKLDSVDPRPEIVCVTDFKAGGAFACGILDVTDKQIAKALDAVGYARRGRFDYRDDDGKMVSFRPYSPKEVLHRVARARPLMGDETSAVVREAYRSQAWKMAHAAGLTANGV